MSSPVKITAVIANDTGRSIKYRIGDNVVSVEWIGLTAVSIGVIARTSTQELWAAIQAAIKTPGAWIEVK